MIAVLLAHVAVAAVVGALGGRLQARVFWIAALAPASTVIWLLWKGGDILDGAVHTETYRWVPGLGINLDFRVDAFTLLMLSLVGGIGVLVMVYASQYFHHEPGLARFGATLTMFAGAMTGLVTADHILLVFVFWELTSVTSYGLIGFKDKDPSARASATQAFLITGAGGLALMAGLLILGAEAGTYSMAEIVEAHPSGTLVSVAAVLILAGCFTKSAQVPFHGWLPGAMAAPTPVSAYLHSATMVKAGVFLIARLSPAMSEVDLWRALAVSFGVATMLWGGYRSLRQHDLKLILAYGTVSQLGMLVATFGGGEGKLYLAGAAMLIAHGVFKAPLFMAVGIIDHATHTRDIRKLTGLASSMRTTFIVCAISGASMAGVIPLFGWVAKETIIGGFEKGDFWGTQLALAGIVVGSAFTAAYTLRFMWGAFSTKPGVETEVHAPGPVLLTSMAVLVIPTIVLGVWESLANDVIGPGAVALYEGASKYELLLWPGLVLGVFLSFGAIGAGVALFALRDRVEAAQAAIGRDWDAASVFHKGLYGTLRGAAKATRVLQPGSLPTYLGVILSVVAIVPAAAIVTDLRWPDDLVVADSWVQFVVVCAVMFAAAGVTVAKRRFGAVLTLGAVGFGVAALFVIQGAPDLALTQVLVETVIVAIFVLVLRHLPERFTVRPDPAVQYVQLAVAGFVGAVVFALLVTTVAVREAVPVDADMAALAYSEGDGRNIVNVTLVDFRGFDTLGEAIVLVIAALGVVALVRAGRQNRRAERDEPTDEDDQTPSPRTEPTEEVPTRA